MLKYKSKQVKEETTTLTKSIVTIYTFNKGDILDLVKNQVDTDSDIQRIFVSDGEGVIEMLVDNPTAGKVLLVEESDKFDTLKQYIVIEGLENILEILGR